MEIVRERRDDALEVRVKGRLDTYWADHLARALDEAMRGGDDRIRLDMVEVSYMSSAGIRVLLKFRKQLEGIRGSLVGSRPSEAVRPVLEHSGLAMLLAPPAGAPAPQSERGVSRRLERGGGTFELFEVAPGARLHCRAVGAPELLAGAGFT